MSNSSFMGGSEAPTYAPGRDVDALGPSDTSDSGSDIQGETQMPTAPDNAAEWGALTTGGDNDSDALGTGERASATGDAGRDGADILPDRVFDPDAEAAGDDELLAGVDAADLPDDTASGDDDEAIDAEDENGVETDAVADAGRSASAGTVRRR